MSDSMPMAQTSRKNGRMAKSGGRRAGRTTAKGKAEDSKYRQSSTSDGTAINNSNSTNYNSNNVTNAPTGVGSASGSGTGANPNPKPPRR